MLSQRRVAACRSEPSCSDDRELGKIGELSRKRTAQSGNKQKARREPLRRRLPSYRRFNRSRTGAARLGRMQEVSPPPASVRRFGLRKVPKRLRRDCRPATAVESTASSCSARSLSPRHLSTIDSGMLNEKSIRRQDPHHFLVPRVGHERHSLPSVERPSKRLRTVERRRTEDASSAHPFSHNTIVCLDTLLSLSLLQPCCFAWPFTASQNPSLSAAPSGFDAPKGTLHSPCSRSHREVRAGRMPPCRLPRQAPLGISRRTRTGPRQRCRCCSRSPHR